MAIIAKGTRVSNARKSVKVGNGNAERKPYVPTKAQAEYAAKTKESVKDTLNAMERYTIELTNISEMDLELILEGLKAMQSRYRITQYGDAMGGGAKHTTARQRAHLLHTSANKLMVKITRAIRSIDEADFDEE
jgi:hypothetical protein